MLAADKNSLLKQLPPMTGLLKHPEVAKLLERFPNQLVIQALRHILSSSRTRLLTAQDVEQALPGMNEVVTAARAYLQRSTEPRIRHAINATGIILHTGLGRAVFPSVVVDSLERELKGYCTLATDRNTGERAERDELLEPLLKELTGAEAATAVNNNAAATLLVLAAIAAGKEVVVSRGQLIEIGGSFRLPEVMAESRAILAEVGATNRTHLKDYRSGINERTAAIMRVHPSNYRIVGFTSEPALEELSELAREKNVLLIDDLGAGALVDLKQFGLPHEPMVQESIRAGADLVLFSGDKLIGAAQSGIIVGRKDLVSRIRKHPLMRAMRLDKTCAMILERTLRLFLNPEGLRKVHPLYQKLSLTVEDLRNRANDILTAVGKLNLPLKMCVKESGAYLGSGALPTQALPSFVLAVSSDHLSANELARRLRTDAACVFARIEADQVYLDARTIEPPDIPKIAEALQRVTG